jgi:hypothetical protein
MFAPVSKAWAAGLSASIGLAVIKFIEAQWGIDLPLGVEEGILGVFAWVATFLSPKNAEA